MKALFVRATSNQTSFLEKIWNAWSILRKILVDFYSKIGFGLLTTVPSVFKKTKSQYFTLSFSKQGGKF